MKKLFGKNRKCKQCGGEPVLHVSLFGPLVGLRCPDGLYEGTWTNTAPILDYAGRWMVNVSMEGQRVFVPVKNIIVHKERRRG